MTDLEKLLTEVTPSPWTVPGQPNKICADGCTSNGHAKVIATANEPSWMGLGEPAANARLIAMSPILARKVIAAEKLVDACRHAVDCLDNGDINVADSISEPFREALAAWEAAQ